MANDLLKYGAIGVLLFGGYRYWRAYKVGSNLDIEISGVMANAISKNNFSIGVNLDVTNKSTERITLSNSNLKCYINGRYVGVAKVPYTQIINASTTTKVFVVVDVFYKEVFAEWWNMFVQLATTVKLTIAGSLKFNGVYVPIPAIDIKEFKMNDLFGNDKASVSGCSGFAGRISRFNNFYPKKEDINFLQNEVFSSGYIEIKNNPTIINLVGDTKLNIQKISDSINLLQVINNNTTNSFWFDKIDLRVKEDWMISIRLKFNQMGGYSKLSSNDYYVEIQLHEK